MTLWNTTGVKPTCLRKSREKCSATDCAHKDFPNRALFWSVADWHARYDNQDHNLPTQEAKNHGPPEQIIVHQSLSNTFKSLPNCVVFRRGKTTKTKYFVWFRETCFVAQESLPWEVNSIHAESLQVKQTASGHLHHSWRLRVWWITAEIQDQCCARWNLSITVVVHWSHTTLEPLKDKVNDIDHGFSTVF